ncbi:putative polygalacturonase [Helianthus annuus]|uniref:Polygalacturonase n=1 Tax=Helianthus annuus TaxID=4232 RepID=A0A251U1A8_HELAN|nr:polygalacturonase At1g48100 [Helianthus annuus]KAF5793570.1 putative polygalacturonase [Helianthus annuus]KAJ0551907.1 putative endo-polygalacturonase [Helianthus annuus]KAJ0717607.1 putative endo-polygalacturonase [Helianthus annuus]KAJ0720823.1 putative endo-polygalacturonase [Helianthus annuus]KAJ0899882.1 putative polygalacturonase [Helianthus annuus]
MGDFSFRKLIFAFVIVTLVWASSIETCNARRGGKHWRQSRGTLSSLYKKKGKNDHGHKKQKSKQEQQQQQPLPTPEEPLAPPPKGSKFNVLDYGAKGDGHSDDTKAFQGAWADACKVEASTMIVPSGYEFLVGPISFSGPYCQRNILFQLDGTIIAPINANAWGKGLLQWLEFTKLVGLTIKGKGTIDGRGSVWWTKSILDDPIDNEEQLVVSSYNTTLTQNPQVSSSSLVGKMPSIKPTALRFYGSFNVTVTGITIQNSPQCHLKFDNCDGVLVYSFSVASPGDSPNTDGIHLQNSKNVLIHTTDLACGDDCISIQTGCTNVFVRDVNCGPGHGISIGSLGKDGTSACVSNITVRNINMHNTMTGVRIKTWQGGSGSVQGVLFSNIQVSEVEFPIMIDQYYCDHSTCKNHTSAVAVSNIAYENIRGTYTVKPVHVSCSDNKPCRDVRLTDIELKPVSKGYHMYEPFCWQAFGELYAPTIPEIDCIQQGAPSSSLDPDEAGCAA